MKRLSHFLSYFFVILLVNLIMIINKKSFTQPLPFVEPDGVVVEILNRIASGGRQSTPDAVLVTFDTAANSSWASKEVEHMKKLAQISPFNGPNSIVGSFRGSSNSKTIL
ncbi:hypothetical protein CROQUDRAFT_722964 [Cronartium quercuum f. sp. fusiforme G11]|uniref:Uncharacterized protein n=1 Tax=Cronartium quercuum f. sp. fusiforme G11 TaxID=708437 RepID=A0A9P6TBH0_9BASI|nr:hypothetical protein CROQUDRAFT_722964 [Cronartium quercuum f. sp. fusiforme G11]